MTFYCWYCVAACHRNNLQKKKMKTMKMSATTTTSVTYARTTPQMMSLSRGRSFLLGPTVSSRPLTVWKYRFNIAHTFHMQSDELAGAFWQSRYHCWLVCSSSSTGLLLVTCQPTWDESLMYQATNTYAQLHLHLPFQLPDVLQLVIAPSSSQPPLSGTSFLKKSDLPHHYLFSDVDWKLMFLIAFNSCKVIEVFLWKHLSL